VPHTQARKPEGCRQACSASLNARHMRAGACRPHESSAVEGATLLACAWHALSGVHSCWHALSGVYSR